MSQVPWANQPSGTMKAAVLASPGAGPPASCFTYSESYPRPTLPGPGWTIVRVRAFGVNRAELRSRLGMPAVRIEFGIWQKWYHEDPPKILGEDMVGEVVESASDLFKVGDKIITSHFGGGKAHDGSYAEFSICHERRLFHLPENTTIPWEVLGALPMPFMTAYTAVLISGRLASRPAGSKVIIHGATSAVGIFSVLIAKDHGATVIATTRQQDKLAKLTEVGADYALLESELDEQIPELFPEGVDVIVELVGCDQTLRSLNWLALLGTVVIAGILNHSVTCEGFSPVMIPVGRNLSFASVGNDGAGNPDLGFTAAEAEPIFAYAIKNLHNGKWKKEMFIDTTYTLHDVGKAHERAEKNDATGRLVVVVP